MLPRSKTECNHKMHYFRYCSFMYDSVNLGKARNIIRGIRKTVQQAPSTKPSWTVDAAREAVAAHLQGDFAESSKLAEAMLSDDDIPATLHKAVSLIVDSRFTAVPVTKQGTEVPEPNSVKQAQAIEPLWNQICNTRAMAQMVQWYMTLGVAVGELVWDTKAPVYWRPKLHVLHPQFLRHNQTKNGGHGSFEYVNGAGEIEDVTPGDGRWVLLGDRHSYVNCGLRAIASSWLSKQYALRDWNRYNERHGMPIVKAKVPFEASSDNKQDFFNAVSNMGSESVAMLPTGLDENGTEFDLELLEARDPSWESFKVLVERCDRKIQLHYLGSNTNELIDASGSRNTTQSGRDIAKERASEREREIMPWIREQVIKPFSRINIPDADLDLAPDPHYKVMGDADSFKEAESAQKLFEAITAAKMAGYQVNNAEKLALELGLDIEKAPEPEVQPEEVAPKDASETPDSNRDTSRDQPQEQTNGKRVEAS